MKRAVLLALLLAACAPDPQVTINEVFPQYRDQPIEAVMAKWGPPEQAFKAGNGMVYTWASISAGSYTSDCRAQVHLDHKNKIIGIRATGTEADCNRMYRQLR